MFIIYTILFDIRKMSTEIVSNSIEWNNTNGSKNTSHALAIAEAFDFVMKEIVVKEIPEKGEIEDTYVFKHLLKQFNKVYWKNLNTKKLLYSRLDFDGFMSFIELCLVKRYLIINKECEHAFFISREKLRQKYAQNLSSVQIYYDEIVNACYEDGRENEKVRNEMTFFVQAYSLGKALFINEKRESWERYFEHLKWVMEIVLRELPKPNLNKILIALLHDIQEDLPEYADVVRIIYKDYIADGVNALSKKDWKLYLTAAEKENNKQYLDEQESLFNEVRELLIKKHSDRSFTAPSKIKESELINAMNENQLERNIKLQIHIKPLEIIAKERRNEEYFGHLDKLNDDYLDVKLADRIHNLRDVSWITKEKALRKIAETEKYFLSVSEKRNPTAYGLIMREINKLKASYGD